MMRPSRTSIFAGLILAFASASVRAEIGVSEKEIKIGSCSVLTGRNSFFGTQMTAGARAYFEYVNDHGGVHGRRIVFNYYDDHYEASQAILCFKRQVEEGVFAMAIFTGSATSAKYVNLAEDAKMPVIGFSPGPQFLYHPLRHYVFTVRASYRDEIEQLVDHLWSEKGLRHFAIVYQQDAYGADLLEGLKQSLRKHGAEPTVMVSYPADKFDVDAAVKAVQEAKPEAVLLALNYTPAAQIIKKNAGSGWKPVWFLNSGAGTEALTQEGGPQAEGTILSEVVPPFDRTDLPTVARYRRLMKKYAPTGELSFASLRGYVAAMVLVEGLRRAGKAVTREGLVSALESIQGWDAGLGKDFKLDYGPSDHQGAHKVFFVVLHDGRLRTIDRWK